MKFIKFLPHAGIIAILASIMQFIEMSSTIGGTQYFFAWIGFAAWACYFLNGCTPKGGAKVIGCWIAGVVASILIYELAGKLCGTDLNPKVAVPLAVGIIAFFVILFEKVPPLAFIPGWFIGAACFFGLTNHANGGDWKLSIAPVLISCVIGQIFGFVTVFLRTAYGKAVETTDAK
jgi:hypothetical protein